LRSIQEELMSRELIHIYGPISIQSFGLIVAIALSLFTWLVYTHKKRKQLVSDEQFSAIVFIGVLSGIVGGRLLFVTQEYRNLTNIWDALSFWEGGFSILGTIVFALGSILLYLKKNNIPALPFLDLIAIYAPLAQSISRIGCFVAGCCYGAPTNLPWAVAGRHPTQLYSSLSLFIIFLFIRFVATRFCTKPGQLIFLYLACAGAERFFTGFWRGDCEIFLKLGFFSMNQWIGLLIAAMGLIAFFYTTIYHRHTKQ